MKKNMLIGIIIIVVSVLCIGIILLSLYLSGNLGNNSKEKKSIKVVDVYPQLAESPSSIKITFNDEYQGTFIIEDAKEIKDICDIIINRTYYFGSGSLSPNTNRILEFIYSENEEENVTISTRYLKVGNDYYYPKSNDNLDFLIQEIGVTKNSIFPR